MRTWFNATGLCKLHWVDVRNPEAASTAEPSKNLPSLAYFVEYFNATTGSKKSLQDILNDSENFNQVVNKVLKGKRNNFV